MAWPDGTTLPVEVWAALGADATNPGTWVFTDLTNRLQSTPIPFRRGASDGAGEVSPSSGTVYLDNDDGALTPLNPGSTFWPNVEMNTPVRILLRRAADTFTRTSSSGWGTADSGQVWTMYGSVNTDFPVTGGVGKHSHGVVNTLRRTVLGDVSLTNCEQLIDVATPVMLTGAALVTGLMFRHDAATNTYYWLRLEFNAGGSTVALKLSRFDAGVGTDLAALDPVPGLSYATNTPIRVRAAVVGTHLAIKAWTASGVEPAGWQIELSDTALTGPGQVAVQSWLVAGNSNPLPVAPSFDNYKLTVDRLTGFADQWQPTFTPSGGDVVSTVRLTASGILRRLSQGQKPFQSALTRAYQRAGDLIAWWPMEEPTAATQAQSGLPGGSPMVPSATSWNGYSPVSTPTGVVTFGVQGAGGTPRLVNLSGGGFLNGPIPVSTLTSWQVEIVARVDTGTYSGAPAIPISWFGGETPAGKAYEFGLYFTDTGAVFAGGDPDSASSVILQSTGNPYDGQLHHYAIAAQQNGADTEYFMLVDGVLADAAFWSAITLPKLNQAIMNYYTNSGDELPSVGHFAAFAPAPFTSTATAAAAVAHVGEPAADRIERLCAEAGIPVTVSVGVGDSEPMGPQRIDTLMNLLREAERADMGILHEHGWGLGYLPRSARYNRTPALTVDLSTYARSQDTRQDQVLAPTYDDQGLRNDWTVSRVDGATVQVVDAAHAARFGTYDDSTELSVATDSVLPDHAGWRVHRDTWQEMRYPSIPVDLAANPNLIDQWLNLGVGDRATQINTPAPHPPGDVDQIVGGCSEILAPNAWSGQAVGTPAGPWTVGVVEDPVLGRADTDGWQLTADLDAGTDTTMTGAVTNALHPLWINSTDHAAMFPFDFLTGGSRLTATAIAVPGTPTSQTGTVAHGNNASVVPGLPASIVDGDLLLMLAAIRNTAGLPSAPAGWTRLAAFPSNSNVQLFGRIASGAVSAPTVTFTGGVANASTSARIVRHRGGNWHDINNLVVTSVSQVNASAQDIAYPPLRIPQPRCMVFYLAWKQTSWTTVAQLAGATEIMDDTTATGDDQSLAMDRVIQGATEANIAAGTFVVTGGVSAISRAAVVAIRDDAQTVTITQTPVNGVERTVTAGTPVSLADPWRAAL